MRCLNARERLGVEKRFWLDPGTGPGPEKMDAAIPYAEQHDWIYATVGVHPHEAKQVTPEVLARLAELAKHPKVIAWGEDWVGLFLRSLAARDAAAGV